MIRDKAPGAWAARFLQDRWSGGARAARRAPKARQLGRDPRGGEGCTDVIFWTCDWWACLGRGVRGEACVHVRAHVRRLVPLPIFERWDRLLLAGLRPLSQMQRQE